MLFHTTISPKAGYTHEDQKKVLAIWANWEPPEGFEIKSFYLSPNGGGFLIIEADSAEAIYESTAPWVGVLLEYDIVPVVDVDTGVGFQEKGIAAREKA